MLPETTSFATFGDYLRELRGDLMFREVSARCGLGTGTLVNFEQNRRGYGLTVRMIPPLARGYGVSVQEMTAWALHFFAGQERP